MNEPSEDEVTFIYLADSVRAALIKFAHTGEISQISPDDLSEIYELACEAIGQIQSKAYGVESMPGSGA